MSSTRLEDDERRARLAARHLLLPSTRTDDVPGIADAMVALHSSDPPTVYLSAMVRMAHPSVAAVEQVLYLDRQLIRHHAMRRTLWVATPAVVRRMHAAATLALVEPERRRTRQMLAANGVAEPEAWLAEAEEAVLADLREHGPSTARAVGQRLPALRHPLQLAPGKSYAALQGAHTRVLTILGFAGKMVRTRPSSWVNGSYAYAATEDWLPGGLAGEDPRVAAADLAGHWLRRFGPGTTTDLAWWMGWPLRTTRQALADCGAVQVELTGGPGWLAPDDEPVPAVEPWVAVLPGLDPTTMGWKQRDWYLPAAAADAFDNVGNGGPTLWVDGRIVGAWAQTRDGQIHTHYFEPVPLTRRRQIDDRIAEVRAMIGDTRFTVRFPGNVHARILG
jgi:Winged helix DNA-binding domain